MAEFDRTLSAPEAHLLLSLPRFDLRYALKIGLMGLIAQGVLRLEVEDRPGLIRTRHIARLTVAPAPPPDLSPLAQSFVRVVGAAAPDGLLKHVLGQAEREYGRTLVGLIQKYVGPALIARGLAEPKRRRVLGLFPYDSFALTAAGEAEKTRVAALIEEARSMPRYLDSQPDKAAALITALGAVILLVDGLRPHYAALDRALRDRGAGDSLAFVNPETFDHGGGHTGCFDFAGIDFACFDSGAFDSFDAGFSDAGGGDGGNSGC